MAGEASPRVPITRCCVLLGLARSRFYRWRARLGQLPSPQAQDRALLAALIVLLFQIHHERPGRRPMQHLLAGHGYHASLGRIDRLMRDLGLQARRGRKYRQRRRPGPSPALTAHITNRCQDADGQHDFTSTVPGAKTVGDITQLPTGDGPRYLATVVDLSSRRVLGWAIAPTQDTALTMQALTDARARELLAAEAVFHSDRGTQYTSHPFQDHCRTLTVSQSMGATGVCYDNAVAEAFFAALKGDLASELGATTPATVVRDWIEHWITDWYNDRRPHTANGGLPPTTAWNRLLSAQPPVSDP